MLLVRVIPTIGIDGRLLESGIARIRILLKSFALANNHQLTCLTVHLAMARQFFFPSNIFYI